jgi:hypothetical protein
MDRGIKESDWKLFGKLHQVALERFCERTLAQVAQINANTRKTHHQRYLEIWHTLKDRDRELGQAFDDKRRSTAITQLAIIRSRDLLTDAELAQFSEDARKQVASLLEIFRT